LQVGWWLRQSAKGLNRSRGRGLRSSAAGSSITAMSFSFSAARAALDFDIEHALEQLRLGHVLKFFI
jgi:hypothetical protein